jgi:hypothetical protein
MKIKSILLVGVAAMLATSVSPAFARQGADDPAGHVRREDRQADRATEVRSSSVADRSTSARETEAKDVRRARGADDAPGHVRGADDVQPHN